MKGNSTRTKGPRHLDARTVEGRAYRLKVGKAAFAKARRNAIAPGTTARKVIAVMKAGKTTTTGVALDSTPGNHRATYTPEVKATVKAKPFNWSAGASPTLAQIDADIAYREEVLSRIKGLRDILASMNARITAIAAG